MAVQAEFFGDNNNTSNNNQNMGLGIPFSLPLPVMPQDWPVASSSYLGIEENNGACFQKNSMQIPITNPQFHQVFQFLGHNNININRQAAVLGPSSFASSSPSLLPMEFSQFLASELEKQRVEMESYLQLQNERLRVVRREETRQRVVVLQKYETKLMSLVQQKDKELALANNRRLELQECLVKSDFELQSWKQKAMENDALIFDLTNKINQVKERLSLVSNGVPDSESICDSSTRSSSAVIKNNNYFCKVCHVRSSCVLLFPCRHLCCCQSCEGFLGFCPVCEGVKKASIEVFLA